MRHALAAGALYALALSFVPIAPHAWAGPADYVSTPIVEEGEREIDFKAGTAKSRDGTRETQYSVGLGLGINSWWFTEVYAIWHKMPGESSTFDAWEWENKFQLTETGKYPVDVGFLFEIERPKDRSEGYEYRWGPLLQADITPTLQANLNLLFEKHVRSRVPGTAELGYQWQLKYRWSPFIEGGMQGFGDVGAWDRWEPKSQQTHVAGPAIFGRIKLGGHQSIRYNTAMLFGLTEGAPRHAIRVQAEYEF